jgi:hypothetical protein
MCRPTLILFPPKVKLAVGQSNVHGDADIKHNSAAEQDKDEE